MSSRDEIDARMNRMSQATLRPAPVSRFMNPVTEVDMMKRCTEIADQVVPEYRVHSDRGAPSCTGTIAKRWQAAWDAACIALGGDPKEYRS